MWAFVTTLFANFMAASLVYGLYQAYHRKVDGFVLLYALAIPGFLLGVGLWFDVVIFGIIAGHVIFALALFCLYRLAKNDHDLKASVGIVAIALAVVTAIYVTQPEPPVSPKDPVEITDAELLKALEF